jgi:hypothetical protein
MKSKHIFSRIAVQTPWWLKILFKLILSRLPISYKSWKSIGVFDNGQMQSVEYALRVFQKHFEQVSLPSQFISLELGPGDSLLSALIAKVHGGSVTYLVDSGNYADQSVQNYKLAEQFLRINQHSSQFFLTSTSNHNSLEEICKAYSCNYYTSGLVDLRLLKSESVDFIWSQAVLEHIPRSQFVDTMSELRRIIRPDGICSHVVDLKDHLGGALNNLRFPEKLWESNFMASSGFYTNRIRYSEMLEIFSQIGFSVEIVNIHSWESIPTPRLKMTSRFRSLSDSELCISGFHVLLRPN